MNSARHASELFGISEQLKRTTPGRLRHEPGTPLTEVSSAGYFGNVPE